jgi:quercetin dioxygenase-like cupin family protein
MRQSDLALQSREAGNGEWLDLFGPQVQLVTALSDEDDGYCLFRGTVPAGAFVPVHSHADRETFYILGGELQGLRQDRWLTLAGGDVLDIPGGVKHAFSNLSAAPVSLVFVTTMRLGRFFCEVGRPVATVPPGPPTPADLQRFLEISHAYGHWLGSPEDNAAVGISLD